MRRAYGERHVAFILPDEREKVRAFREAAGARNLVIVAFTRAHLGGSG